MARILASLKPNAPSDDFQRAVAAAEAAAGKRGWFEMTLSEQTRAIYAQLRQIDAARAKAMAFVPQRRSNFRAAGDARRSATA